METATAHLELAIDVDSEPISGSVSNGGHLSQPFSGWIELVAAIEAARSSVSGAKGSGAKGSGAKGSGAKGSGANGSGANGSGANGSGANGCGTHGSGAAGVKTLGSIPGAKASGL